MKSLLEYANLINRKMISPIANCKKDIEFSCVHFTKILSGIGMKMEHIGETCEPIGGQVKTLSDFERLTESGFDYSFIEDDINYTKEIMLRSLDVAGEGSDFILTGGGFFGPITITSKILGIETFSKMVIKNPSLIHELQDYITSILINIGKKKIFQNLYG